MSEHTYLYRFYDQWFSLLYVGITSGIPTRFENHAKSLADCLTQIRVFEDDGQIVSAMITKAYATAEEPPGARVSLWRLP